MCFFLIFCFGALGATPQVAAISIVTIAVLLSAWRAGRLTEELRSKLAGTTINNMSCIWEHARQFSRFAEYNEGDVLLFLPLNARLKSDNNALLNLGPWGAADCPGYVC